MIPEKIKKMLNKGDTNDIHIALILMFKSQEIRDLFNKRYVEGQSVVTFGKEMNFRRPIVYFMYNNERFVVDSFNIFKSYYPGEENSDIIIE